MSVCPTCNTEMKPLFTGEYCPKECDLKKSAETYDGRVLFVAPLNWSDGMGALRLLNKVPPWHRQQFENEARGRGVGWLALRNADDRSWHAVTTAGWTNCNSSYKAVLRADLVFSIWNDGTVEVFKNRQGSFDPVEVLNSLPDYRVGA